MRIYIIADADTVLAYRLVGIPGIAIQTQAQALEAWKRVKSFKDCGVVLMGRGMAQTLAKLNLGGRPVAAFVDELRPYKSAAERLAAEAESGEAAILEALGLKTPPAKVARAI